MNHHSMATVTPDWLRRPPTARRNSAAADGGSRAGSSTVTRLTPAKFGAKPEKRMFSAASGIPPSHTCGCAAVRRNTAAKPSAHRFLLQHGVGG